MFMVSGVKGMAHSTSTPSFSISAQRSAKVVRLGGHLSGAITASGWVWKVHTTSGTLR